MTNGAGQLGNSATAWHAYRLICINDVYTFNNSSGHGGFASAASLINRLRDECGGNCLVTVNGDFLGGSRLAELTKGKVIIDILNQMKIDAVVLGNHEFDFSTETLIVRISESNFAWLGANIAVDDTGSLIPGTIDGCSFVTKDGLRIGLFGVCTPSTPALSYPSKETVFSDPLEVSMRTIQKLRQENEIDLMVGLTHLRRADDVKISESIDDVDILLGGHDHDPFCQYKDHTLLMKCGQNAYWVGVVDLSWRRDEDGKAQWYMSWSMQSTAGIEQDQAILDIVSKYEEETEKNIDVDLDEILLRLTGDPLDTRTVSLRTSETTSGNLVADCLFAFFNGHGADPDLGMINGGFIRGDRLYPEDGIDITRRFLNEEMPFPKNACCLEITGDALCAAVEQHIKEFPHAAGSFPHFSHHVRVNFSRSRPTGSRVISITVNGETVVAHRKYRVATSLFIAGGGDHCTAWAVAAVLPDLPVRCIPDIVAWVLERRRDQKTEVFLKLEGRVSEVAE